VRASTLEPRLDARLLQDRICGVTRHDFPVDHHGLGRVLASPDFVIAFAMPQKFPAMVAQDAFTCFV
jgi:hypothetical protein